MGLFSGVLFFGELPEKTFLGSVIVHRLTAKKRLAER